MSTFADRIAALPPARRQLLETLLQQQSGPRRGAASYAAPRTPVERTLADIWALVLGVERVGIHDSFFELGGDSIQSIQIIAKARRAGLQLTNTQLFTQPTIAGLSALVNAAAPDGQTISAVGDDIPLTPIQQWFFDRPWRNIHHWNQAVLLHTAWTASDDARLRLVSRALVLQHEALRLRFRPDAGRWCQILSDDVTDIFSVIDLSALDPAGVNRQLARVIAAAHRSLHISNGPLLRLLSIRRAGSPQQLLLVSHHLIADAISFRALLEDVVRAMTQRHAHGSSDTSVTADITLLSTSAPWSAWSRSLEARAALPPAPEEVEDWRAQLARCASLPVDYPAGSNRESDARRVTTVWTQADTAAVRKPRAGGATLQERLVAALCLTLSEWTGGDHVSLWLEGHGRDDDNLDLSHTVGWFTSLFPLRLQIARADSATAAEPLFDASARTRTDTVLAEVRRSLRTPSRRGQGFGLLRFLSPDEAVRSALQDRGPEVLFNFFGALDEGMESETSTLTVADELAGDLYDPDSERPHTLQIYGGIVRGRLTLHWAYSAALHRRDTIDTLAARFRAALADVTSCDTAGAADALDLRIDPGVADEDVRAILASHDAD